MGLFDSIAGQALGALAGNNEGVVADTLAAHLKEGDGLQKVMGALGQGGLAQQAASWVGTGANEPAPQSSLLQIVQSTGLVTTLAQKTGISAAILGPIVAQVLPAVIDRLTPDGKLPGA